MKSSPLKKYTIYTYFLLRLRNFVEREVFSSGFFHIPGYKELYNLICKIDTELNFVINNIPQLREISNENKTDFLNAFLKYTNVLKESTVFLGNILEKLKLKSEGGKYPWDEYNKDVEKYEESVAEYMRFGEQLSELGKIHNRLPKEFLNFLEETIEQIIKLLKNKMVGVEIVDLFKNSIFDEK